MGKQLFKMKNLFIIIPVFNEEQNVQNLFKSFDKLSKKFSRRFDLKIILVNDGSTDKTVYTAKKYNRNLNLKILNHKLNKGPGSAFASAFHFIRNQVRNSDWIITMEGDNTSRYQLIEQMLKRADEGFEVVLASPYMYGGGFSQTSFLRKFLSSCANILVKELLGIQGIFTVSSFFRLYSG